MKYFVLLTAYFTTKTHSITNLPPLFLTFIITAHKGVSAVSHEPACVTQPEAVPCPLQQTGLVLHPAGEGHLGTQQVTSSVKCKHPFHQLGPSGPSWS